MANRNWANGGKIMSMHVAPVLTNATIVIGASGAVTSFTGSTVQSVVRNGTGLYTITLQPLTNFSALYFASGAMQSPPSGLSTIMAVEIQNAPSTSVQTVTGAVLQIKTLDVTGALANPASGSAVSVLMFTSNSSVKA